MRNRLTKPFFAAIVLAVAAGLLFTYGAAAGQLAAPPPLQVEMAATVDGSVATYNITLRNTTANDIADVFVAGLVPAGGTFKAATGTPSGSWFRGVEAAQPGLSAAVWLSQRIPAGGTQGPFTYQVSLPSGAKGAAHAWVRWLKPSDGVALSASSVPSAPATKAPTGVLSIVPVAANPADPNVITATLSDGKTAVQMGATGLRNVSVGVPVTLKGSSGDPNAPARRYSWTLTKPSNSKATLTANDAEVTKFTPDVPGVYKVDLVAANEAGNSRMESVQIYAGTYVGIEQGNCKQCHPAESTEWAKTNHAVIFKREIDGGADPKNSHYSERCVRCHTTGYYIGAQNGGFADVQAKTGWKFPALESIQTGHGNWDAVPAALKNMANIQCEACHGPAQQHVASKAPMAVSLDEGVCNVCHDGGGHHVKGVEFKNAKHSHEESRAWTYPTGPARQDCVPCHSGKGFISFTKNPNEKAAWDNSPQTVTCGVCHDPHSETNKFQLRLVGKPLKANGLTKDFGLSAACVECHNVRTQAADAVKGQFPHYSSAAELLSDTGGVTYGQTVANSPHGMLVGTAPVKNPDPQAESPTLFGGATPGPCVTCHMWPTPADAKDPNRFKVGEHSFNVTSPDGTFEYTASCQSCHPGVKDFKFKAKADYDGNGKTETVQAEVAGLLKTLETAIANSGVKPVKGHPYFDRADVAKANDKQKNAIYNYLFVRGLEGSDGKAAAVHNFKRSVNLLQLSYRDLTGKDVPNATLIK